MRRRKDKLNDVFLSICIWKKVLQIRLKHNKIQPKMYLYANVFPKVYEVF